MTLKCFFSTIISVLILKLFQILLALTKMSYDFLYDVKKGGPGCCESLVKLYEESVKSSDVLALPYLKTVRVDPFRPEQRAESQ